LANNDKLKCSVKSWSREEGGSSSSSGSSAGFAAPIAFDPAVMGLFLFASADGGGGGGPPSAGTKKFPVSSPDPETGTVLNPLAIALGDVLE
jgi:hypothetical protein